MSISARCYHRCHPEPRVSLWRTTCISQPGAVTRATITPSTCRVSGVKQRQTGQGSPPFAKAQDSTELRRLLTSSATPQQFRNTTASRIGKFHSKINKTRKAFLRSLIVTLPKLLLRLFIAKRMGFYQV